MAWFRKWSTLSAKKRSGNIQYIENTVKVFEAIEDEDDYFMPLALFQLKKQGAQWSEERIAGMAKCEASTPSSVSI